tara:strand:+ start:622 stop:2304 length:1683 start_codon:yes stop_codon:yes gene_type:complete
MGFILRIKKLAAITNLRISSILVVLFFFVINSINDLIGLALIGPFVSVAFDSSFKTPEWVGEYSSLFEVTDLGFLFLILVFFSIIKFFVQIASNTYIIYFGQTVQLDLRRRLLQKFSELPLSDKLNTETSDLLYSLQNLVPRFGRLFSTTLKATSDVLLACIIIAFLTVNFTKIILIIVAVMVPLVILYEFFLGSMLQNNGKKLNASGTALIHVCQEISDGFQEIKTYNKFSLFEKSILTNNRSVAFYQTVQQSIQTMPRITIEFLMVVFTASIIITDWVSGSDGQILSVLSVFAMASLRLIPAATQLIVASGELRFESSTLEKIDRSINWEIINKVSNNNHDDLKSHNFSSFSVSNVSVAFDEKILIEDFEKKFNKGSIYGIHGPSGAGKTTLVNTLIGLLPSNTGSFCLDDRLIDPVKGQLYSRVAKIPQQPFIMNRNLYENVTLTEIEKADKKSIERFEDILSITGLHDVRKRFDNFNVGGGGDRISGGQKQRVAIARALFHERDILIFDEATNSLDSASEERILKSIQALKKDRIIFLISHSQTVLSICDDLISLG